MRNLQKLYAGLAVLILILGIGGCQLFDKDAESPTLPASSDTNMTPIGAGQLANFYVGAGLADFYAVYVSSNSFVVNIPTPGMYRLTYYTRSSFGLSDDSLENLEEKGVPADILESLEVLVDQTFTTQLEFLQAISDLIGEEYSAAYEDLFLRYAYGSRGGPFYLVAQVKENSVLYIGLNEGDKLLDAAIDQGDATTLVTTTPDALNFGSVVVFYKPGLLGAWSDYFVVNSLYTQITLVSYSALVISTEVIELEVPSNITKRTQKYTKKSKK